MRPSCPERLESAVPAAAGDVLPPLAEALIRARGACAGDLDAFLILLVLARRASEDPRLRALSVEAFVEGEWTEAFGRAATLRSIAAGAGIAKETARRKVGRLVEQGWIERRGRRLQISREGARQLAPVRDALLGFARRSRPPAAALVDGAAA